MDRHNFLRRVSPRQTRRGPHKATAAGLLDAVRRQVIDRFAEMSEANMQAVVLTVHEPDQDNPPANPSHPACVRVATSDYCRGSWQLHLSQLKHQPEVHWGTCAHRRLCGIVPIVSAKRCLAVVKLAGPASLDKSAFKKNLERLQLLVREFAESHSAFLNKVPGGISITPGPQPAPPPPENRQAPAGPSHPQVIRALDYISRHLGDPRLNVAWVASELGIYPTYLSQLFAEQVGERMSRYITNQRLARARDLLSTTNWQIKRIAIETGFANPNWFSHVFALHVGLSPGQFRKKARSSGS